MQLCLAWYICVAPVCAAMHRPDRCKDPLQQLKQLQEAQQLTSSLLAAAAELAKQGTECSAGLPV